MVEQTLVPTKIYLQVGAHIGTRFKSEGMQKFIFKSRSDKLKVLDVNTIDKRIRIAAKFLSSYDSKKIVVVARKPYGKQAVKKFTELINANKVINRFVPGTFTNPEAKSFIEPQIVLVLDPSTDEQAIKEAKKIKVPVIAFCSTDNPTKDIDLILPINNNGRQSIALAFMLLAREILKNKKEIKNDSEFKAKLSDFEYKMEKQKNNSYNMNKTQYNPNRRQPEKQRNR